tara:strand:+ start:497 stop:649 length:153 start_codon:yes stop_codon:yes gene_type:complete
VVVVDQVEIYIIFKVLEVEELEVIELLVMVLPLFKDVKLVLSNMERIQLQ